MFQLYAIYLLCTRKTSVEEKNLNCKFFINNKNIMSASAQQWVGDGWSLATATATAGIFVKCFIRD